MDIRPMSNCDNGCELPIIDNSDEACEPFNNYYEARKMTAKEILEAVYNPEINFIEYLEEIISAD